ncbi:substrate-binding periplasmic protein [Aestuariibacter salexigens]|uniref:substrate-binding periplasmic protein n=1 Tax=Aestuariibacter salexigens TaxID=226010 RepID=UPI00146FC644|nr:transporter substrate-binding domain-containing protein [Aestuariibacter salexigens]
MLQSARHYKYLFRIIACCALLVISSSGNAAQPLIVYTEPSPPFQTLENGVVTGIATDRVRALLQRAGVEAEFEIYPWARAVKKFEDTGSALLFGVARTPQREDLYHWIAKVARYELSLVGLANRDDIVIDDWDALKNFSIAVQRRDISYQWLKSKGLEENKHLLVCPDIQCSWRYVMSGHVDMILEDTNLIEPTATEFGYDPAKLRAVRDVPDLAVDAYLVAHKSMPIELIKKLQNAAED